MPFAPKDIPFLGPDIAELLAVLITMGISFAIMVALGYWWAR